MHSCITETKLNNSHYSKIYIIYNIYLKKKLKNYTEVCEHWQKEYNSIQQSKSVQIKHPNYVNKSDTDIQNYLLEQGTFFVCVCVYGKNMTDNYDPSGLTSHFIWMHGHSSEVSSCIDFNSLQCTENIPWKFGTSSIFTQNTMSNYHIIRWSLPANMHLSNGSLDVQSSQWVNVPRATGRLTQKFPNGLMSLERRVAWHRNFPMG